MSCEWWFSPKGESLLQMKKDSDGGPENRTSRPENRTAIRFAIEWLNHYQSRPAVTVTLIAFPDRSGVTSRREHIGLVQNEPDRLLS